MSASGQRSSSSSRDCSQARYTPPVDIDMYSQDHRSRFATLRFSVPSSRVAASVVRDRPGSRENAAKHFFKRRKHWVRLGALKLLVASVKMDSSAMRCCKEDGYQRSPFFAARGSTLVSRGAYFSVAGLIGVPSEEFEHLFYVATVRTGHTNASQSLAFLTEGGVSEISTALEVLEYAPPIISSSTVFYLPVRRTMSRRPSYLFQPLLYRCITVVS